MSSEKKSTKMRYAHSEGHTDMCFHNSGRFMVTGGDDGDIRIWEGIEGDDTAAHIGNKVYAVVAAESRFYTANDMNSIQAYTFPECAPDGIVARFTAPVTHMCLSVDLKTLAAGASDFMIKVIDLDESTSRSYEGHEAPLLSVALHPQMEFLASSSCDGTVRIWSLKDHAVVKVLTILPKYSDFSLAKSLCRLAWEPRSGKSLLVPVSTSIHMYGGQEWKKIDTLKDDHMKQDVSLLRFSACRQYLAASCRNGAIVVWAWPSKSVVVRTGHERGHTITALCWNPAISPRQLAFCDSYGQLSVIDNIVPETSTPLTNGDTSDVGKDVFDDDDFPITADGDMNEGDKDDDDNSDVSNFSARLRGAADDGGDTASLLSDAPPPPTAPLPTAIPAQKPAARVQSAFQPSSTPEDLTNRFMKWNTVGVIRQYNGEDDGTIDIEFHDAAVHHAMHLSNVHGFTKADLSTDAVLLASPATDDANGRLQCLHFGSWDNCREWSVDIGDNEDIVAVVVGGTWVGVATDSRYVRLFTISGVQLNIICVPGPVVCLAAFTDFLFIVYHRAAALPGDQCLGCQLINVKAEGRHPHLIDVPLPLSHGATLSWAGFSIQGTPFACDSGGCLRMLNRRLGNTWTPVANIKKHTKGKSDNYWIVGISEDPQQIRCVPCKGSRYPPTLPRPAVVVLPFELPFCELHTEKSQFEVFGDLEVYHRSCLFTDHFDHWSDLGYEMDMATKAELLKPAQEALMKLYALSVRGEREFRAVELCALMRDDHTLQLALKYATRLKRLQLAQRISELALERKEQSQRDADDNDVIMGTSETLQNDGSASHLKGGEVTPASLPGPMLKINTKSSLPSSDEHPAPATSWTNPFKLVSQDQTHVFRGSQVFDDMTRTTNKPANTTSAGSTPGLPLLANTNTSKLPKKSTQGKLFVKTKTSDRDLGVAEESRLPSAFDLWLRDNEDDLRSELPDLDDAEGQRVATERFQRLARDEKQVYLQKARAAKNVGKDSKNLENKKRKWEGETTDQKKPKNETESCETSGDGRSALATNNKLSGFRFNQAN